MRIEGNNLVVWNTKAKEVSISFDEIALVGIPHDEKEVDLFHSVRANVWVFQYMITKQRAKELKLHYWAQTHDRYSAAETYVIITTAPSEYETDNTSDIIPISKEKIFNTWEAIRDYKRSLHPDN